MKRRLVVVVTVSDTINCILNDVMIFLAEEFELAIICSDSENVKNVKGVPCFSVPMRRGISPFFDLYSMLKMFFVLRRLNPDIVHSYTPKAGLVTMVSSFFSGVKIRIHTFTGLVFPSSTGFKKTVLNLVDRVIFKFSSVCISESKGVRSELIEGGVIRGDDESPIIGNGNIAGVDTEFFDPSAVKVCDKMTGALSFISESESFVFCFVGRFNKDKGIKELVESFLSLSEHCHLVMVGDVDSSSPPDDETLAEISANPRIHDVGFQNDIRPYLMISDVLVLPSYREGFPNVVLQALALERPVLSTNVSGANEVVIPGFTGWVVPIGDGKKIASCMAEITKVSSTELQGMGLAGLTLVCERFEKRDYYLHLRDFYCSFT